MSQILKWGVTTLNLDSISQLQQLCEIYGGIGNQSNYPLKLGLRLNYPELTGDSRIGVRQQEFVVQITLFMQQKVLVEKLN